jgi:hypothetical protein
MLLKVVTSLYLFENYSLGVPCSGWKKNKSVYHKTIQNITQTHEPNNYKFFQ